VPKLWEVGLDFTIAHLSLSLTHAPSHSLVLPQATPPLSTNGATQTSARKQKAQWSSRGPVGSPPE